MSTFIERSVSPRITGQSADVDIATYNRFSKTLVDGIRQAAGERYDSNEILSEMKTCLAPNVSMENMGHREYRAVPNGNPIEANRDALKDNLDNAERAFFHALMDEGAYRKRSDYVADEQVMAGFRAAFDAAKEVLDQTRQLKPSVTERH